LDFLAGFSATGAGATGAGAAAAGAASVFLETRFAAVVVVVLLIVLLPVEVFDIFKRVMPFTEAIPSIKFYAQIRLPGLKRSLSLLFFIEASRNLRHI
jgi:hypothetical protein